VSIPAPLALGALVTRLYRESRVLVDLMPSGGDEVRLVNEMRLVVRNKSKTREFWGKARILAVRNPAQAFTLEPFSLAWVNAPTERALIQTGDSRTLRIADVRWESHTSLSLNLHEFSIKTTDDPVLSIGWSTIATPPPAKPDAPNTNYRDVGMRFALWAAAEIDLEVSVWSEHVKRPHVESFTVRPRGIKGPLEMIPIGQEERPHWFKKAASRAAQ